MTTKNPGSTASNRRERKRTLEGVAASSRPPHVLIDDADDDDDYDYDYVVPPLVSTTPPPAPARPRPRPREGDESLGAELDRARPAAVVSSPEFSPSEWDDSSDRHLRRGRRRRRRRREEDVGIERGRLGALDAKLNGLDAFVRGELTAYINQGLVHVFGELELLSQAVQQCTEDARAHSGWLRGLLAHHAEHLPALPHAELAIAADVRRSNDDDDHDDHDDEGDDDNTEDEGDHGSGQARRPARRGADDKIAVVAPDEAETEARASSAPGTTVRHSPRTPRRTRFCSQAAPPAAARPRKRVRHDDDDDDDDDDYEGNDDNSEDEGHHGSVHIEDDDDDDDDNDDRHSHHSSRQRRGAPAAHITVRLHDSQERRLARRGADDNVAVVAPDEAETEARASSAPSAPVRRSPRTPRRTRKRVRHEEAAASTRRGVRTRELESMHPARHTHHEEPQPRRLHQPATDRRTPIVLLNNPSADEFDALPAPVQRRVARLCDLVLHGALAPSHALPQVLCDWWGGVRLEREPHGQGCWLAAYAPNKPKPKNGYWQARIRGQSWMGHVLAFLVWYRCIDPVLPVSHTCHQGMCMNPQHLVQARDDT